MNKDILLEIGTEDIPSGFVYGALVQLKEKAEKKLNEERIGFSGVRTYGTHRRLVLHIVDVSAHQDDSVVEVKGPPKWLAFDEKGRLTESAQGFARSQGIMVDSLVVKTTAQGEYVFAKKVIPGLPTLEVMKEVLPELILSLSFPKSMRWTDSDLRFARPIRWLLALYGSEVVKFSIDRLRSGNFTFGHRFLAPQKIKVSKVKEYWDKLQAGFVIVDPHRREELIKQDVRQIGAGNDAYPLWDERLLQSLTFSFEYPTPLLCSFDHKYLALPRRLLVTLMQTYQQYVPLVDEKDNLLPWFIALRDGSGEGIELVREGNERVLKARLEDAAFFFQKDQKRNLEDRVEDLRQVMFHEHLGSLYDKTNRVVKLVEVIADELGLDSVRKGFCLRAAELCKADLVTDMVYEFPELQGVMGREYALLDGELQPVADGIFEHYLPRFAGDELPKSVVGKIVSLADKLDMVVSFFSQGIIPSGSEDPYGVRRQGLGLISLFKATNLRLSLDHLMDVALGLLGIEEVRKLKVKSSLLEFLRERVVGIMLAEEGIRHDFIEAVLAVGFDDLSGAFMRAKALGQLAGDKSFVDTVVAATRVINIVRAAQTKLGKLRAEAIKRSRKRRELAPVDEEERESLAIPEKVNERLLAEPAELALFRRYGEVKKEVDELLKEREYREIFGRFSGLNSYITDFFDNVMVMVGGELESNRLALLLQLQRLLFELADFSRIEIERV